MCVCYVSASSFEEELTNGRLMIAQTKSAAIWGKARLARLCALATSSQIKRSPSK